MKGRGVQSTIAKGDLLVTVEIVVPKELTPKEKAAIEALRAVTDWSPRSDIKEEG